MPVTIEIQNLSLLEKAETVPLRFLPQLAAVIRASPMAMHLHLHLRFFIRDVDADARLGPSGFDFCKSRMRMSAGSDDLLA